MNRPILQHWPRHWARHGFTIPEMLAVVALIMIIIALLLPSLSRAKELARRSICLSQQHQISVGSIAYSSANQSKTPEYRSWAMHFISGPDTPLNQQLLQELTGDPQVYYCPSDERVSYEDPIVGWNGTGSRYMSYGPIGIWQQSLTTNSGWAKHYVDLPEEPATSVDQQGNRPKRRYEATSQVAMITDSQIAWYAGSWGISFTYPGDDVWPDDPGYYAYYAYPHRTLNAWAGTNVVYFDGSGEWRNTSDIVNESIPYPHGAKWIMHYKRGIYEGPVFW